MKIDPLEKVRLNKRIETAHATMLAGDAESARVIFEDILGANPEFLPALHGIGVLCVGQGRLEEAEHWLRKAIEVDGTYALAWNDLGEALRMMGRGEEAISAYQHTLELQPDFPGTMNNLAVALAGMNEIDEATRMLRKAIDLAPGDPHPINNLGVILESQGAVEEALLCYEKAVKLKHDFEEARQNYADLLARNPDFLMQAMGRLLDDAKALD